MPFEKTRYWIGLGRRRLSQYFQKPRDLPIGERGESLAAAYLKRKKYRIVERNYRQKYGEIDLIAIDGRTVVFVEVKTRTSDVAGLPESAVDAEKQRKIVQTAQSYLQHHQLLDHRFRFDIVSVMMEGKENEPKIQHFQNAFADETD